MNPQDGFPEDLTVSLKPPTFSFPSVDECSLLCFEGVRSNPRASIDDLYHAANLSDADLELRGENNTTVFCFDILTGACTGVIQVVQGEGYCVTWEDGSGLTGDPFTALSLGNAFSL